jgi:Na+/glutamate symporter
MRRRIAAGAAVVGLSLGVFGGVPAGAVHLDKNDAAEACREADEQGVLEELGVTRGECVNSLGTPGNENARSRTAALCGQEFAQQFTGTTNKGQCIQALNI